MRLGDVRQAVPTRKILRIAACVKHETEVVDERSWLARRDCIDELIDTGQFGVMRRAAFGGVPFMSLSRGLEPCHALPLSPLVLGDGPFVSGGHTRDVLFMLAPYSRQCCFEP